MPKIHPSGVVEVLPDAEVICEQRVLSTQICSTSRSARLTDCTIDECPVA